MGNLKDETGNRFGRLVVIQKVTSKDKSGAWWLCLCDCGATIELSSNKLRTEHTKSCGCLKRDIAHTINRRHGMSRTRTYKTWKEMRARCAKPQKWQYKYYGAKGINVCKRWESFELFYADMGDRPEGTSIDRINPEGDYEPTNCRWATPKQQAETNSGCFKKGLIPWNKGVQNKH